MPNFLIICNRRTGEQSVQEFLAGPEHVAIRARFAAERANRADHDIEVVVLSSASREMLEQTHTRYFKTTQELMAA
ncbi:MAG TPA: hypothetical protein VGX23_20685 [Actinocrinis sp.]|nr:hypothetical protein [Actinocrinis sp.]